ncbi:MAG: Photosynthesis system assembly factor [Verrucomicrobiota bacterium]
MNVLVATVAGSFAVDLDTDEVEPWSGAVSPPPAPVLNLPRVVAAAAMGATVVAVVDAKPPILVSHDSGSTWRESGRGLPPGRAIAISDDDPDLLVYAGRNLLYVSRNGGVFWSALALELPEIERLEIRS